LYGGLGIVLCRSGCGLIEPNGPGASTTTTGAAPQAVRGSRSIPVTGPSKLLAKKRTTI